ncbi:MAG: hypothetical protein AAF673_02205 [Pseudomonadota bacterium]
MSYYKKNLTAFIARKKHVMLSAKLRVAYIIAEAYSSFSHNNPNSSANEENVVNPPRNPDIKKYLTLSETVQCRVIISVNRPITKDPTTLTNKIGSGMPKSMFGNSFPMAIRDIAPNAPPRPMKM